MPEVIGLIGKLFVGAGSTALGSAALQIGSGLLLNTAANALLAGDAGGIQPADGRVLYSTSVGYRSKHYGRVLLGGQIVFGREGGAGNDPADTVTEAITTGHYLHRIIVHGQGPVAGVLEYRLDGQKRRVESDGRVLAGNFSGGNGGSRLRVRTNLGAVPETSFAGPVDAASSWTAAHRLDGLFATYLRCEQRGSGSQLDTYPDGPTDLQVLADTTEITDPRTGITKITDNAALVIAHWIEGADGFGLSDALDPAELVTAANTADILRPLVSGGSVARWRLAGTASMAEAPSRALRQMLTACAGDLRLRPDGKIGLQIGGDPDPVMTLTDADVLEFLEVDDGADALDRFSTLPARYVDEALDYAETTAEPWVNESEVTRLGKEVIGEARDLRWAPNHAQARHAMKIAQARANPLKRARIRFRISALPAIYERTIALDCPSLGLSGTWRVEPFTLSLEDMSVTLNLAQISQRLRDWSVAEEGVPEQLPAALPDPDRPPAAPRDVQAYGSGTPGNAGIAVAFEAVAEDDVDLYVSISPAGANTWSSVTIAGDGVSALAAGLTADALYDVAVIAARSATTDPAATDASAVILSNVRALEEDPAPSAPTGLEVEAPGAGAAVVRITAPVNVFLRALEILRDGVVIDTVRAFPGAELEVGVQTGSGPFSFSARGVSVAGVAGVSTPAEQVAIF